MTWHRVLTTILSLIATVNTSEANSHVLPGVGTDETGNQDSQAIELSLLMDHLDTHYTPDCLRVVVSYQGSMKSPNDPIKTRDHGMLDSLKMRRLDNPNYGDDYKPYINIIVNNQSVTNVKKTIIPINKNPGSVNHLACITYMLSRPPDSTLLPVLADKTSTKRLTRYFLVYTQTSTEAEQILLDQRLGKEENVAALVQEESQNKSYWRVLIRQLLHPSGSPQVLTVNRWSRDTGLTSTENIFPEQMANFYGQKLTGVALEHIPFTDFTRREGSLFVKYKPCVNYFLISTISSQLNFTFEMKMPADGLWGYLDDTGHFVGVVGDVEFERANFAFDLTVNTERSTLVDFTDYYVFDSLTFLTPKSRPDPQWRKLITPFRASVWLCVLISVGGGSLLYHVIYHAQATLTSSRLLSSHAFMHVLASFLSQSLRTYLSLQAGRVFLGSWFLYAFLVTTYYKTSLTSTLAVPYAPPTIDTIDELLQSGLPIGMKKAKDSAYQLFSTSDVPLYQTMFKKMVFNSWEESMRKVGQGQYSYLSFKYNIQLLAAIHNNNPKRKTDIHLATDEFFHSGNGCAFPQGAPYRRTFNAVMQKCLQAGLIGKWIEDALPNYLKESRKEREAEQTSQVEEEIKRDTREVVLNLNHLQGPFFILFLGFLGGGLLLVVELLLVGFTSY